MGASSGRSGPARLQTLVRRRGSWWRWMRWRWSLTSAALCIAAARWRLRESRSSIRTASSRCSVRDARRPLRVQRSARHVAGALRRRSSRRAPRRLQQRHAPHPGGAVGRALRGRVRRRRQSVLGAAARLPTGRSLERQRNVPRPARAARHPGPGVLQRRSGARGRSPSRARGPRRLRGSRSCAPRLPHRGAGLRPGRHFGARASVLVTEGLAAGVAYPGPCQQGKMGFFLGPQFPGRCPNGKPTFSASVSCPSTLPNSPACVNLWPNNCPLFTPGGTDCRAYNLFTWGPDQRLTKDQFGRTLRGSFYRIHASASLGGSPCTARKSDTQVGCLTPVSPCSIGSVVSGLPRPWGRWA